MPPVRHGTSLARPMGRSFVRGSPRCPSGVKRGLHGSAASNRVCRAEGVTGRFEECPYGTAVRRWCTRASIRSRQGYRQRLDRAARPTDGRLISVSAWKPSRAKTRTGPLMQRASSPDRRIRHPFADRAMFRFADACTRASVPAVGRGPSVRIVSDGSRAPLRKCRSVRLPSDAFGSSPWDSMDESTSRTTAAAGPPPSVCPGGSAEHVAGAGALMRAAGIDPVRQPVRTLQQQPLPAFFPSSGQPGSRTA